MNESQSPDPRYLYWSDGTAPRTPRRTPIYQPDPPPRAIVNLGLSAGALEGLIAGWIYGGIAALLPSMLIGAAIGSVISVTAWRIRRRAQSFLRPFLLGLTLEALGGGLIVLATRMNNQNPVDLNAPLIVMVTLGLPASILFVRLIRREIVAMRRGFIVGVIVGPIGFSILMGTIAAQGFGGNAAILLFVFGGIIGILMGGMFGYGFGLLLGGLVGALVNVTRTSIAPTYGGLAAAIGLGIIGFHAGEAIAAGLGGLGVAYGVIYGALLGAKFGKLVTPHLLAFSSRDDEKDPDHPPILDLSDARDLADAGPAHLALGQILLLAIRSHFQQVRLEQYGNACITIARTNSSSSTYSCPFPLCPALMQLFIDPPRIDSNGSSGLADRQERRLRLRLSRHQLDVYLAYESVPDGEQIDLRWNYDPAAAKQAERIAKALRFILKVRSEFMAPVVIGRGSD